MTAVLILLVGAIATTSAQQISFQVFTDPQCTQLLRPGAKKDVGVPLDTSQQCVVRSYISPLDGHLQTNSFGRFHCTENSVTWTHWPSSTECGKGAKVLIDTLYSDSCVPIQTHMGITYQKLLNYVPCASTYDYSGVTQFGLQSNPSAFNTNTGNEQTGNSKFAGSKLSGKATPQKGSKFGAQKYGRNKGSDVGQGKPHGSRFVQRTGSKKMGGVSKFGMAKTQGQFMQKMGSNLGTMSKFRQGTGTGSKVGMFRGATSMPKGSTKFGGRMKNMQQKLSRPSQKQFGQNQLPAQKQSGQQQRPAQKRFGQQQRPVQKQFGQQQRPSQNRFGQHVNDVVRLSWFFKI